MTAPKSKLRQFLEATNLVVPETTDTPAPARSGSVADILGVPPTGEPSPPPAAPSFTPDSDLVLSEGVELNVIYAEASVPTVAFPIERLAKIVDGLNQLDTATKKVVIASMDAADDTWTVDDVLGDARAKIAALRSYMDSLSELDQELNAEVSRRIEAAQAARQTAVDDLEAEIAALQAEREQVITSTATQVAQLRAQGTSASEAADRERLRITTAIKQHDTLASLFTTLPSTPSVSS